MASRPIALISGLFMLLGACTQQVTPSATLGVAALSGAQEARWSDNAPGRREGMQASHFERVTMETVVTR